MEGLVHGVAYFRNFYGIFISYDKAIYVAFSDQLWRSLWTSNFLILNVLAD